MSRNAERTRVRNDGGRTFGSPKKKRESCDAFHEVLRLARRDVLRMAALCQQRYKMGNNALRRVRYENVAAAVEAFYATRLSKRNSEKFDDAYESTFGHEPNKKKMLRACFMLTYGIERKTAAGTDAIALRDAVRDKVGAADIPQYIKDNGGLEKMRRTRTRRVERLKLTAEIDADGLKRFDQMKLNDVLFVRMKKVCDAHRRRPALLVTGVRSRWKT